MTFCWITQGCSLRSDPLFLASTSPGVIAKGQKLLSRAGDFGLRLAGEVASVPIRLTHTPTICRFDLPPSIAIDPRCGKFAATFFLASLAVLGLTGIDLENL